jgi:hypothetical protein
MIEFQTVTSKSRGLSKKNRKEDDSRKNQTKLDCSVVPACEVLYCTFGGISAIE